MVTKRRSQVDGFFTGIAELVTYKGVWNTGAIVTMDNGSAWEVTGNTGAPSQTPAQRGNATLTDANGNEFIYVPVNATAKAEIHATHLGAVFDNVTDDLLPLQATFNAASAPSLKPLGGGVAILPKGIARTSAKLEVDSDCAIRGAGKTQTYIKPLDSATFAASQAVIQSTDFETTQGTNLWDYYSPYPAGLIMGFTIRDLTIDGNRANVANAGGLNIYGGKWDFQDLGVINTASHGIWTEAGIPVSSTSGDDLHDFLNMHESYASNVYISNANKHGWYYRGPNDTGIGHVQIKTCEWGGFFQESTGNNSVGNLEIDSIHAYSCKCLHDAQGAMITLANANAKFLYVDASYRNGLICNTTASVIDYILVLGNNQSNAGSFWGVKLDVATQIGMIRNSEKERTSGTDGGLLQVNADSCVIGQVRTVQTSTTTIAQKGVEINNSCDINKIVVESYDSAGSVGVDVSSSKVNVDISSKNNLLAVDYNAAGRNDIKLNGLGNTTDINLAVALASSDILNLQTNNKTLSENEVGRVKSKSYNNAIIDVASTASYTPNMLSGSYIKIGGLATNITFNAPTNPTKGDKLTIQVQQDGTGGRTLTFNSNYKTNYSNTGNTAFTRHTIEFIYDGTFFIQQGAVSGWY